MKFIILIIFTWPIATLLDDWNPNLPTQNELLEMPVHSVLTKLGDTPSPHIVKSSVEGVSSEKGKELVFSGQAIGPDGKKGSRISPHFVCTSCHNTVLDEPDLKVSNPEARLHFAEKNNLPYLQGSAFYGIVDRSSFYNGDYEKKYGGLVSKARHDLREAIQLCATECSQGRLLKDWELESIVAYFWTIGLKVKDLNLDDGNLKILQESFSDGSDKTGTINLIKSHYLSGMPATFLSPPANRKSGLSNIGNLDNGRILYERSCLYCHSQKNYSQFMLDNSIYAFQFLNDHFTDYSRYSVYQVARYGTSPIPGKKAYMPNYTAEKMSEQMLEDLRVYIKHMSEQ